MKPVMNYLIKPDRYVWLFKAQIKYERSRAPVASGYADLSKKTKDRVYSMAMALNINCYSNTNPTSKPYILFDWRCIKTWFITGVKTNLRHTLSIFASFPLIAEYTLHLFVPGCHYPSWYKKFNLYLINEYFIPVLSSICLVKLFYKYSPFAE